MSEVIDEITTLSYVWDDTEQQFASMVPPLYLLGIGAVITNWSIFEMLFDNFLEFMRWCPGARNLAKNLPSGFEGRRKLLASSAGIALPNCAVLLERIQAVVDEAHQLARRRNDVTHGHWMRSEKQMVIYRSSDDTRPKYLVSLNDLLHLADLIRELHHKLFKIQICYLDPPDNSVPEQERAALRTHFENLAPERSKKPLLPIEPFFKSAAVPP